MRFRDKVAWVTGASSGIGEALARALHGEGADVVLSAPEPEELGRVAASCTAGPGQALALPFDLTEAERLPALAAEALAAFGRIDLLANVAGISQRALVADTEIVVYRRLMEVNFFGAVGLTKAVLPAMIERGAGHIVAVTSVAGKYGSPLRSGYCASKHALHGFFDSLRCEVAAYGVKVTLITPGAVATDISLHALLGDGREQNRREAFIDAGMSPADCAAAILDAVALGREEALIGGGAPAENVHLKRFAPEILSRRLRLAKGENAVRG